MLAFGFVRRFFFPPLALFNFKKNCREKKRAQDFYGTSDLISALQIFQVCQWVDCPFKKLLCDRLWIFNEFFNELHNVWRAEGLWWHSSENKGSIEHNVRWHEENNKNNNGSNNVMLAFCATLIHLLINQRSMETRLSCDSNECLRNWLLILKLAGWVLLKSMKKSMKLHKIMQIFNEWKVEMKKLE